MYHYLFTQAEGVVAMVDVVLNHRTATAVRSRTPRYVYIWLHIWLYIWLCVYIDR